MFNKLKDFMTKPEPFTVHTRDTLWTKPHLATNMLKTHLDQTSVAASRPLAFIDKSVSFIDSKVDLKDKKVVDFGCGPGLYTERYAKYGASVTGIDFSGNSIDYARKISDENGLNINYLVQDYLTFKETGAYDFASLIYCDFCAIGPTKRKKLLEVINDCLFEGGMFLLDVHTLTMFNTFEESEVVTYQENGGFFSPDSYVEMTKNFLYPEEKISLTHHMIIEENETWDIYNWLQFYDLEALKKELAGSGFEVIEVFDNVAGDKLSGSGFDMAVICSKV